MRDSGSNFAHVALGNVVMIFGDVRAGRQVCDLELIASFPQRRYITFLGPYRSWFDELIA